MIRPPLVLGAFLCALPMAAAAGTNHLVDLRVQAAKAGAVVEVVGSRPPSFSLQPGAERVVVTIDRATLAGTVDLPGAGPLRALRGETAGRQTLLVLEVETGAEARLATEGTTLRIRVEPGIGGRAPVAREAEVAAVEPEPEVAVVVPKDEPAAVVEVAAAEPVDELEPEPEVAVVVPKDEPAAVVEVAAAEPVDEPEPEPEVAVVVPEDEQPAGVEVAAAEPAVEPEPAPEVAAVVPEVEPAPAIEVAAVEPAEKPAPRPDRRAEEPAPQPPPPVQVRDEGELTRLAQARAIASAPQRWQELTHVGFQPGGEGARVVLRLAGPPAWRVEETARGIAIVLERARIPRSNERRAIDASFFGTPVGLIRPIVGKDEVRVEIALRQRTSWKVRTSGQEIAVIFEG